MSIEKKYLPKKGVCQVTFRLPIAEAHAAKKVFIVGDFNEWSKNGNPMRKSKEGDFAITLEFPFGTFYQFRYLIDGLHWENDDAADAYMQSPFGSDNSVVMIDAY